MSVESLREQKCQDFMDMEWEWRAMRLFPRFLARMTICKDGAISQDKEIQEEQL